MYFCDRCGYVFNTPSGCWREIDDKDEDETCCPKCGNRDYELINGINQKENENIPTSKPRFLRGDNYFISLTRSLAFRFRSTIT
jgi:hypothetical protein